MAYKRKTEDVYEVVYNYGYGDGLEVLTQCSTMREAKADRKAYIENEHICPKYQSADFLKISEWQFCD